MTNNAPKVVDAKQRKFGHLELTAEDLIAELEYLRNCEVGNASCCNSTFPFHSLNNRLDAAIEVLADYTALEARLREVEADARRYRWLADNIEELPYTYQWEGRAWLDARIDAALTDKQT